MVLHIAPRSRWEGCGDQYRDPSLETEGFIHCSTADQVLMPADALFAGRDDLVLLVIDPGRVPDPVVFEDCYESGIKFPHIYGPIPTTAVVAEIDFPCRPNGGFDLPAQVAEWTGDGCRDGSA